LALFHIENLPGLELGFGTPGHSAYGLHPAILALLFGRKRPVAALFKQRA
jgi:hypothetical protein